MAVYTFYLCRPDGSAASFEAFELASDAEARRRAPQILAEHPSCAYVAVWDGDRCVATRHRKATAAPALQRSAAG